MAGVGSLQKKFNSLIVLSHSVETERKKKKREKGALGPWKLEKEEKNEGGEGGGGQSIKQACVG